ncbi:inositol monophosphatase family protein [Streptomyces sp. NPDC088350]|uniref:inositol monophosphatase family protein n=1 Tax=Streptomyces sp. NPDC088350 TaxID=3365854 RepID=UPI0037F79183
MSAPAKSAPAVPSTVTDDSALLPAVVEVAERIGARVLARYSPGARPVTREDIMSRFGPMEEEAAEGVQPALAAIRPQATWLGEDEEEQHQGGLPAGEWWVSDLVEGAINHLHGLTEWGTTITLVRDNEPVLGVVHQPLGNVTHTAVRGGGAFRNGTRLRASAKTDLKVAMTTTSQDGGEDQAQRRHMAQAFAAMLGNALLVRSTVPTTFPLLGVAAGQYDAYWQFQPEMSGVGAGVLLATEAGAIATDLYGRTWRPGADLLVAAPGVHAAALNVLSSTA